MGVEVCILLFRTSLFAKRAFFFLNCVINGHAARLLWELPLCDQISKSCLPLSQYFTENWFLRVQGLAVEEGGGGVSAVILLPLNFRGSAKNPNVVLSSFTGSAARHLETIRGETPFEDLTCRCGQPSYSRSVTITGDGNTFVPHLSRC